MLLLRDIESSSINKAVVDGKQSMPKSTSVESQLKEDCSSQLVGGKILFSKFDLYLYY